ncbi:energy-coupling factor transporter transmembrane component T [Thiohalorhabdus sp.]|uniref:energy-coupling factor transporter transmembrane component T n=1 Tax=Thiohalorhabdus sp. TaxID=3094134 RepID=UPI002FC3062A
MARQLALHPGAKVVAVLLVATVVLLVRSPFGLLATAGLVALAAARTPGATRAFTLLVTRLRWVFLFIILLHGWFTPGESLVPGGGAFWPSRSGLTHGLELVIVVMLMAAMVAVLVQATPVSDLAAGVAWVLAPLARLGLPVGRFSQLLAWTLDRVEPVQQEASRVRDALRMRIRSDSGVIGRLRLEAGTARAVLRRAREAADRNAEALYLRQAGQVRQLGALQGPDFLLVAGALLWAGLLIWLGAVRGG